MGVVNACVHNHRDHAHTAGEVGHIAETRAVDEPNDIAAVMSGLGPPTSPSLPS